MFVAFELSRKDGGKWSLACYRDDARGPWYPQLSEKKTPERYAFFAGFTIGEVEDPDGGWLRLEWDERAQSLTVSSDPFNIARWYYHRGDNGWIIANSLRYLFERCVPKPELEFRAVPYMFRLGYLPCHLTPLNDVFALDNGESLTILSGESSVVRRVHLAVHRRPVIREPNIDLAISQSVIEEVHAQTAGLEQVVIPLSGGMDSRFLLACALEALPRESINTLTFGARNSLDVQIGSALARRLGVTNTVLPIDSDPLDMQLDANFPVAEGVYWTVPDYPVGPFHDAIPAQSLVLSGYLGDPVFGSKEGKASLTESAEGRDDELLDMLNSSGTQLPPQDFMPLLREKMLDPLDVNTRFLQLPGKSMQEKFDVWYFGPQSSNRTLFAVTPARDKAFYLMPYISRRVLDLAFSLPTEMRMNEQGFFSAMKLQFPEMHRFPSTRNHGFSIGNAGVRRMLVRAFRAAMIRLDDQIGSRLGLMLYSNPRANYVHKRDLFHQRHRDYILGCFDFIDKLPVFEQANLRTLRERFARGKSFHPFILRALLTIAQWKRHYSHHS